MVFFGFRTVKTGERVVITSHTGEARVVSGPARITLFRSKARELHRYIAGPDQYLQVKTVTGEKIFMHGPCDLYMNPYEHDSVSTKDAIFVEAGEAVVIYKSLLPDSGNGGQMNAVAATAAVSEKIIKHGPLRYFPQPNELVEKLTRHLAGQGEYLEIQNKMGEKSIIVGPHSLFFDPTEHKAIRTKTAMFVNAGEAIVVYRNECGGKMGKDSVQRLILRGPTQYIPQPNEWTHEFCWHGADLENKTHFTAGASVFTKLRIIADQIYYNVREVRTKDDTLLRVKLMIFFELKNVEQMLDNTHDPIGDFINAAASDVVAFCARLTYEDFLLRTTQLNDLATFEQLCKRAASIGYAVTKVVFRGFHASDALQRMHDNSIQERTKIKLEADMEAAKQQHLDLQLAKEEERAGRQAKLELTALKHKQELEEEKHRRQMRHEEERHKQRMAFLNAEQEHDARKLEKMKALGVDLTKVLVAEHRAPDRHLKIEGGSEAVRVNVHEHASASIFDN